MSDEVVTPDFFWVCQTCGVRCHRLPKRHVGCSSTTWQVRWFPELTRAEVVYGERRHKWLGC